MITHESGEVIFKMAPPPAEIMPKQQVQTVNSVFDMDVLPLPKPGKYSVTLRVNGEVAAETTIFAKKPIPAEK